MPESWQIALIVPGTPVQAAVTLAQSGQTVLLIDSGWPRTRNQLIEGLADRGIQPERVTHILHTHLHIDHAANHSLFSNAALLVSAAEFDWADRFYRRLVESKNDLGFVREMFPDLMAEEMPRALKLVGLARRVCQQEFFQRWDEFQFYEDVSLPFGIEIVPLPGHTPGHSGISIQSSTPTLVAGDALISGDSSLTEMPPSDISQYEESARKVEEFRGRIIPGHFPAFYQ